MHYISRIIPVSSCSSLLTQANSNLPEPPPHNTPISRSLQQHSIRSCRPCTSSSPPSPPQWTPPNLESTAKQPVQKCVGTPLLYSTLHLRPAKSPIHTLPTLRNTALAFYVHPPVKRGCGRAYNVRDTHMRTAI